LAIGSSTLHAYKEYTEPYPSAQLSPIPFSRFFDSFNGWRYPLVGGTGQCHFDGTNLKPHKLPENAQTPTSRVHALFGGFYLIK